MESQKEIITSCDVCKQEVIVPTITDFGVTCQIAPAKCQCGWNQPGQWLKNGFIAIVPNGYYNLRTLAAISD